MKTMRLNKIDGINNIKVDIMMDGYTTSTITMNIQQLYKHLTDGRTCNIDGASLNKDASEDYMSQIYFPLIESTARDLYNIWLNATLNDEDGDAAVKLYIENKHREVANKAEMILAGVDDFDITEADYDDSEELRLIAEYNKMHSDDFRSCVNSISEAANEGLNNVFGYVSEALDNLITAVQDLPDPYLNMMYADEDFEAFINYDPSDNYYVDDFAECYAA